MFVIGLTCHGLLLRFDYFAIFIFLVELIFLFV